MRGDTWEITQWFAAITDSGQDHFPVSGRMFLEKHEDKSLMHFECRDDDGIAYCRGRAVDDDASEEALDFVMNNYGATSLWMEQANGSWECTIG